jgi:hypothetical protein
MVTDHQQEIARHQAAAQTNPSGPGFVYATAQLPVLQKHLAIAQLLLQNPALLV